MNDLDEMLAGIEPTIPEGVLADSILNDDAILDALSNDDAEEIAVEEDPGYVVDKQAIYAEQESNVGVAADAEAAPVTAKERKRQKAAAKKGLKAKPAADPETDADADGGSEIITIKEKLPPATSKSEALGRKADLNGLASLGLDNDQVSEILAQMDSAPKKVGEKAYNMLRFILGRDSLSNFTKITVAALRERPEGMTVPELVKLLETADSTHVAYQPGTARSQSQQMSRLFSIYGMAEKVSGKMTLNEDNVFSKELVRRLAA